MQKKKGHMYIKIKIDATKEHCGGCTFYDGFREEFCGAFQKTLLPDENERYPDGLMCSDGYFRCAECKIAEILANKMYLRRSQ